jgi:hypothetical protein
MQTYRPNIKRALQVNYARVVFGSIVKGGADDY